MIKIITEKVKLPAFNELIYQNVCEKNKWFVKDTRTNIIIYNGKFDDVALIEVEQLRTSSGSVIVKGIAIVPFSKTVLLVIADMVGG